VQVSVLPEKRNVLQRTILNKINVAYSLNKKKACLFALKCANVGLSLRKVESRSLTQKYGF